VIRLRYVTHAADEGRARREWPGRDPGRSAQALDLRPGDALIMRVEEGELRLSTAAKRLPALAG
jgi:hypothetical protein